MRYDLTFTTKASHVSTSPPSSKQVRSNYSSSTGYHLISSHPPSPYLYTHPPSLLPLQKTQKSTSQTHAPHHHKPDILYIIRHYRSVLPRRIITISLLPISIPSPPLTSQRSPPVSPLPPPLLLDITTLRCVIRIARIVGIVSTTRVISTASVIPATRCIVHRLTPLRRHIRILVLPRTLYRHRAAQQRCNEIQKSVPSVSPVPIPILFPVVSETPHPRNANSHHNHHPHIQQQH